MGRRHDNRKGTSGLTKVIGLVMAGLAVAAIVKELRSPPEQRDWNGVVAGFVPYDFRFPTLERAKQRFWAPETERIFSPRVFGVGWTINVGRVVAVVREKVAEL